MPRLNNSADSPQSNHYDCFAWTSVALQTSSIRTHNSRSDNSTSGSRQSLWPIYFSVYASPVLFACCINFKEKKCGKVLSIHKLRHRRNTRYGWLVKPCPTGTYTLKDASSFLDALTLLLWGAESVQAPEGLNHQHLVSH